jgi:hypothetical protein
MMFCMNTYAQHSFDLFGNGTDYQSGFRMNSFESNPINFNKIKNWELSFIYGGVSQSSSIANEIYLISLSKRFGEHSFYLRYTPGILQEFKASSQTSVTSGDSSKTEILSTDLKYEETFGIGYSFDITKSVTAGLSLRFFEQSLTEDNIEFVYDQESGAYTNTVSTNSEIKFWRSDLGISYRVLDNLMINISSANLILLNENGSFEDNSSLELKTDKVGMLGVSYQPFNDFFIKGIFETNNSFSSGVEYGVNIWGGKITFGMNAFHDKYQTPFISSIMPSISFSSRLFNISLLGVKYFEDRTSTKSFSELEDKGIYNILHNQFSNDKILLSVNFALSFTPDKKVNFIDVEIIDQIYPTLNDQYRNEPFARAKIKNLSNEEVNVKPSSLIEGLNKEEVFSPIITIAPNDTATINYFTFIDDDKLDVPERRISQASFYLTTSNSEYDDVVSKPILINDKNSWNGEVSNLRYFAQRDYQYLTTISKQILSEYKREIAGADSDISEFTKIKILFNHFVQQMLYVSDPRTSVEYVQFPKETIERKGGDCDDLSVAFAGLVESIGLQAAFVDYKADNDISHVNLLINTKISPSLANKITNNDKKYFVRSNARGDDEIWIPVEMTSLTDFRTAWSVGSDKFYKEAIDNLGLAKGTVEIIDNY